MSLDQVSAVVVVAGAVVSVVLIALSLRHWHATHRRWAFRAVLVAVAILIVWLGFGATLAPRMVAGLPLELFQFLALGSRLTLLGLVVWLVYIHDREADAAT